MVGRKDNGHKADIYWLRSEHSEEHGELVYWMDKEFKDLVAKADQEFGLVISLRKRATMPGGG